MKHKKQILAILSLLILTLALPVVGMEVSAAESRSVLVSFTAEGEYPVRVSVTGNGYLKDGAEVVKPGTPVEYNLPLGSYKEFEIVAEDGYKLVDLLYCEPDVDPDKSISIIDRVQDGKFTIQIKSTYMTITAVFEKIDDGSGDDSGGEGGNGSSGGDQGGSGSGGSGSGQGGTGGSGTGSGSDTSGESTADGRPSGGRPHGGTGSIHISQNVTTTVTGTKTGDDAMTGWYVLLMLIAAAVIAVASKKNKKVYKES